MSVTQKCQYGLRALFELAKRENEGVVRASDIAQAQSIPKRFLDVILNQLRQGGFVESMRGKKGGFFLSRPADSIKVGEVVRFMDGPVHAMDCQQEGLTSRCPLKGQCVFEELWDQARTALESVYDARTLADLVERDKWIQGNRAIDFSI